MYSKFIHRLPFLWRFIRPIAIKFKDSKDYWDSRYTFGGNSGSGSYGRLAEFKAEIINSFVNEHKISSVLEFGCGDGNQLSLANYKSYVGLDVSRTAIALCKLKFAGDSTKRFFMLDAGTSLDTLDDMRAQLTMSLDVIYHLVEDSIYQSYMQRLFSSATEFVVIYASNDDSLASHAPHVRHRRFSDYVGKYLPEWRLLKVVPNQFPRDDARPQETSFADFYFYHKSP